eukprot:1188501-Prymnesium_polylepis.1
MPADSAPPPGKARDTHTENLHIAADGRHRLTERVRGSLAFARARVRCRATQHAPSLTARTPARTHLAQ